MTDIDDLEYGSHAPPHSWREEARHQIHLATAKKQADAAKRAAVLPLGLPSMPHNVQQPDSDGQPVSADFAQTQQPGGSRCTLPNQDAST